VAVILGTLAATASIVGVLVQVLPGLDQQNGAVLALLAPVNLALGWGVRQTSAERRVTSAALP
jgi:hypothetical protein